MWNHRPVPNQHCTYASLSYIVAWQVWLHTCTQIYNIELNLAAKAMLKLPCIPVLLCWCFMFCLTPGDIYSSSYNIFIVIWQEVLLWCSLFSLHIIVMWLGSHETWPLSCPIPWNICAQLSAQLMSWTIYKVSTNLKSTHVKCGGSISLWLPQKWMLLYSHMHSYHSKSVPYSFMYQYYLCNSTNLYLPYDCFGKGI